jgi:hypothetical protein
LAPEKQGQSRIFAAGEGNGHALRAMPLKGFVQQFLCVARFFRKGRRALHGYVPG